MHQARASRSPGGPRIWAVGAATGLLTAGLAIAVAQLVAAFVGELASPIVAVGEATIDLAPPWLKDFAIREFGAKDKTALLIGIGVLLALFAVVMGTLSIRRGWVGYAGLAAFGVIGLLAAVTRPTRDALSPLPSILGAFAGGWALRTLLRAVSEAPKPALGNPLAFDRRRFLVASVAVGGTAVVTGF